MSSGTVSLLDAHMQPLISLENRNPVKIASPGDDFIVMDYKELGGASAYLLKGKVSTNTNAWAIIKDNISAKITMATHLNTATGTINSFYENNNANNTMCSVYQSYLYRLNAMQTSIAESAQQEDDDKFKFDIYMAVYVSWALVIVAATMCAIYFATKAVLYADQAIVGILPGYVYLVFRLFVNRVSVGIILCTWIVKLNADVDSVLLANAIYTDFKFLMLFMIIYNVSIVVFKNEVQEVCTSIEVWVRHAQGLPDHNGTSLQISPGVHQGRF